MRHAFSLALLLVALAVYPSQAQTLNDFPLRIAITSAENYMIPVSAESQSQAATMGVTLPGFLLFHGAINDEPHWVFSCHPEVQGRESVPCTLIPTGDYHGRWVHDHSLIQIIGGSSNSPVTRFLNVRNNTRNPPSADDPLLQVSPFDFAVKFPNGKVLEDYPALIHVYGSTSVQIPVRALPARTNCNAQTWGAYHTTVNCTASPAIEIRRGYVTAEFSAGVIDYGSLNCEAKWRWSHCAAIEPGFYYARADKKHFIVLTHDSKGDPKEIGFEARLPNDSAIQSPIK